MVDKSKIREQHARYLQTENGRKKAREAEARKRFRIKAKVKMLHSIRTDEEIEAYIKSLNENWKGGGQ